MASSKEMQWIPSGGVLAVAIGAALVAAILVNVYIGHVRSQYEAGSKQFFRLHDKVDKGSPIQERNLDRVRIPHLLEIDKAFEKVAQDDENGRLLIGRKAPRNMAAGEFLLFYEFKEEGAGEITHISKGYELVTIPINADNPFGQQLQPGGYVNIRGEFEVGSDPKKSEVKVMTVLENVQVKALGGSAEPVAQRARNYDNIQIMVRSTQAKQLLEVQRFLKTKRFALGVTSQPDGSAVEPEISKEVLNLIEKPRAAAAPALPPPPE
jgi:Flp pilus assembly protein CpaB